MPRWVSGPDSAARGGYRRPHVTFDRVTFARVTLAHVTFDANAVPPLWSGACC